MTVRVVYLDNNSFTYRDVRELTHEGNDLIIKQNGSTKSTTVDLDYINCVTIDIFDIEDR